MFFVVTVILIGRMTDFQFQDIDIQLHDTYYVIPSWIVLVVILTILGLLRAATRILDRLSDRSRTITILVAIITGLFGLVLIILICAAILSLIEIKGWYPDLDISTYVWIIVAMISLLSFLTIREIKTIRKLRATNARSARNHEGQ